MFNSQRKSKLPKYQTGGNNISDIYNQNRIDSIDPVTNIYSQPTQSTMGANTVPTQSSSFNPSQSMGWFGYANQAKDLGKSMIKYNPDGTIATNEGKAFNELITPDHENMIKQAREGDWKGLLSESTGLPKFFRAFSDITGNSGNNEDNWGNFNRTIGMFANGGMNMNPNAEVELTENTLNPDGTSTQFNGPSHENGGIPTNLDPGTLIFSDKLKYNGKTFADLNKKNSTNKEDKVLEDSKSSSVAKQTAQLMKDSKIKNSLSLFQIQEELKQSKLDKYSKRLGGVQKYPLGGSTPDQYKQAQADSMTLYNAGLKSNKLPSWQYPGANEASQRLTEFNGIAPMPISGSFYQNDPYYNGGYNVSFTKPTMIPYSNPQSLPIQESKPVYHPNYTEPISGIPKSKQKFANGGFKRNDGEPDLNAYWAAKARGTYQDEGIGYDQYLQKYGESNPMNLELKGNPQIVDNNYESNFNNTNTNNQASQTRKNWFNNNKNDLYQLGFGLAQNAGQLAYLKDQGKKYDTQDYYNYNPSLLDPTTALRDATDQTRRAEYNIRGASSGNTGTYLSNRVALNTQNILNKDRIRQQYANQNAQIINQGQQYNIQNKYMTDDINARNKGAALSNYYNTIGSVGTNTAQGLKDNRQMNTDNQMIGMFGKLYDNPEFQKFLKEYKK